ncbi:hypothetical protein BJ165DRAFT_753599 [Panaeolus papilionaceus]|nr:hypothetical protein BJ165DRAFT_753599 [Panaeolus papilionaceus]
MDGPQRNSKTVTFRPILQLLHVIMSSSNLHDMLREISETVDIASQADEYEIVGRVSASASFLDTVGLCVPGTPLESAEYIMTLLSPQDDGSLLCTMYAKDYNRKMLMIEAVQRLYARGTDAEFLVLNDDGHRVLRLRRLVFFRTSGTSHAAEAEMKAWPVPSGFVTQRSLIAGKYRPCVLPCFNASGDKIGPADIAATLCGRLVRVTFVIRHLTMSRGMPNDVADLYIGVIKRAVCLE